MGSGGEISYLRECTSMTVNLDKSASKQAKKKGAKKHKANGATFVVQTRQQGQYIFHQQRKRIEVISLFCDCGRSILVRPKDVEDAPILCSLCNSSFSWQQLSFSLD